MTQMVGRLHTQFKKTSGDFGVFMLKLFSGLVLGFTLALIMQEILGKAEGENVFGFIFVVVVAIGAFLRVSRSWGLATVLVFDLIAVLVGLLLRLYIMVAPGA